MTYSLFFFFFPFSHLSSLLPLSFPHLLPHPFFFFSLSFFHLCLFSLSTCSLIIFLTSFPTPRLLSSYSFPSFHPFPFFSLPFCRLPFFPSPISISPLSPYCPVIILPFPSPFYHNILFSLFPPHSLISFPQFSFRKGGGGRRFNVTRTRS